MAQQFSTILSSRSGDPVPILSAIEGRLSQTGFGLGKYISRVSSDEFDYETLDMAVSLEDLRQSSDARQTVRNWDGVVAEVWSESFPLELIVVRHPSGYLNVVVSIPFRSLLTLIHAGATGRYYGSLLQAAESADAWAGFGSADAELSFLPPQASIDAIWDQPGRPGIPASIGLINTDAIDEAVLIRRSRDRFRVQRLTPAYWLLEEVDYLDIYPQLAT